MMIRRMGLLLTASTTLAACSGGSPADPGSDAGSTSVSDAGAVRAKDAGKSTDAGTTDSGSHPVTDSGTMGISVTMQNSGRHGDTLLFTVDGSDSNAATTEVDVKLLDAQNSPVIAFDTDWDGDPDSAETRLHFDQSTIGQKTFAQTITLPGLYASAPTVAAAVVSLSDANGNLSAPVTVALQAQPVEALGSACDTTEVATRCAEGLACSGTPAKCVAGVAPSLSQVVYYGGANPAQLFLGSDPDEDLQTITVNFLDSTGKSMSVDLSGDGTIASSISLDARSATGPSYFFEDNPVPSFPTQVPKISVTPIDSFGHSGASVVAAISNQPVRSSGQACDAYGLTACANNLSCSPGIIGATNTCGTTTSLQTAKCAAAPAAATTGLLAGWGVVRGTSLWDPPAGCALSSEVGHPESIVMLKLTKQVDTLTISTATPETNFDTVLYVLPACASSSSQALGCNDDTDGYSSTVTLTNVAAGTYAVVVDSANSQAGQFGLSVTTQ